MTGDAISLVAIRKSFPTASRAGVWRRGDTGRLEVLRDVTLQLRAGEIMGLVGSNGAGKTTLLEILATTQLPTGGSGLVGGYDLVARAGSIRRIIGYCPAGSDSFFPRLTCAANLEFFAALKELSPRDARLRIRNVLEMIRATELTNLIFQRCSAGMKQKLSLARALLADPPILLLDEPTRSLDPASRRELQELLRLTLAGAQRKTVLLVTHDLQESGRLCDRVALLRNGCIAGIWPAAHVPADWRLETSSDCAGLPAPAGEV